MTAASLPDPGKNKVIWHGILALALVCATFAHCKGRGSAFACLSFSAALLLWVNLHPVISPNFQFLAGAFFWLIIALIPMLVNKSPTGCNALFALFILLKIPCYFLAEISGGPFGFGNVWLTLNDVFSIIAIVACSGIKISPLAFGDFKRHRVNSFSYYLSNNKGEASPKVSGDV